MKTPFNYLIFDFRGFNTIIYDKYVKYIIVNQ